MKLPSSSDIRRAVESAVSPLGRALNDRRVGAAGSVANLRQLEGPAGLTVTSTSFADGQEIPDRHCGVGMGRGVSPELAWTGVPETARRLLLIVEDLDFPSTSHTGLHSVAMFEPDGDSGEIVEGALVAGSSRFAFCKDYRGRTGFASPRPLPGHGTHHYAFHLYALDTPVTPPEGSALSALLPLVEGHVVASGHLVGTKTA